MGKFWIWEDLGGSGQRCWAAWGPEGFVGDDPGWSLRLWESGCELWGMWKSGGGWQGAGNPISIMPVCPIQGFLPHQQPPGFPRLTCRLPSPLLEV